MSNQPVAETAESGPEKKDYSDAIKKIKDTVKNLPELWLNKPSFKRLLDTIFCIPDLKRRYAARGYKVAFESFVPYVAGEYLYALDTIVSLIVPNTPIHAVTNTIRNLCLLDSMTDEIADKIEFSSDMSTAANLAKILKDAKSCCLKPSDYCCVTFENVNLGTMFLNAFVGASVGSVIELNSPAFHNNNGDRIKTVNARVLYMNHPIELDERSLVIRTTLSSNFVIVLDAVELNSYVVLSVSTDADRSDISSRRIYPNKIPFHVMFRDKVDNFSYGAMSASIRALPFAVIDFKTTMLCVTTTNFYPKLKCQKFRGEVEDVFDSRTEALVRRIVDSGKSQHCSRSYALVGIPGTGKTYIMSKIIRDDTDSVILWPIIPPDGMTYEFRQSILAAIEAIPQNHIYIMLDDFDKCILSKDESNSSNQSLIQLFADLHIICPGEYDDAGNPRKTFTLIATMNNPSALNNAIIKRSERFDEVIEIGLPQPYIYGRRLNSLRSDGDKTDFTSRKFRPMYWYMRRKVITLADIGNIYSIMRLHRTKQGDSFKYTVGDLFYAVRYIGKNRKSASKEYEL